MLSIETMGFFLGGDLLVECWKEVEYIRNHRPGHLPAFSLTRT
jgi:hypothetical protein